MDQNGMPAGPGRRTRIAALSGAVMLAVGAGSLWLSAERGEATAVAAPTQEVVEMPLPAVAEPEELVVAPAPPPLTREQKRFRRADRNDDGLIQQAEYLHQRRRNFDKLDVNGDGRLSFEEYAVSGIEKFRKADADGNGVLTAAEYATTATPPRKPSATAARQCPPCALAQSDE